MGTTIEYRLYNVNIVKKRPCCEHCTSLIYQTGKILLFLLIIRNRYFTSPFKCTTFVPKLTLMSIMSVEHIYIIHIDMFIIYTVYIAVMDVLKGIFSVCGVGMVGGENPLAHTGVAEGIVAFVLALQVL